MSLRILSKRTDQYKPYLAYFCFFSLFWITLLLYAGGFTTSIKAGMAFLDWPLSNGSLNPEGWLSESDQTAEHSHRLLGMKIGFISIILFAWTHLRESRPQIRQLSRILLLLVILQGVLGGARVRLDQLNIFSNHNVVAQTFAVFHACGAQIILCLLVSITLFNTRFWIKYTKQFPANLHPLTNKLFGLGLLSCLWIFTQLIIGAIMRHNDAGLAIPTFPLTPNGTLLPSFWNFPTAIHFAHRAGGFFIFALLMLFISKIFAHRKGDSTLKWICYLIMLILVFQIFLGATVIWSYKNPYAATLHMLVGAFLLALTWTATLLLSRKKSPIEFSHS